MSTFLPGTDRAIRCHPKHALRWLALWLLAAVTLQAIGGPIAAHAEGGGMYLAASLGGSAQQVVLVGDLAYVARGAQLVVLDISHPAKPREIGHTGPLADVVSAVAVVGTHAHLALNRTGYAMVDISDPTRPRIEETLGVGTDLSNPDYDLILADARRIYLVDSRRSIIWILVPEHTGQGHMALKWEIPTNLSSIAVSGDAVFIVFRTRGQSPDSSELTVWTHLDDTTLQQVGTLNLQVGPGSKAEVVGNRLYVGVQDGVQVVDVSDMRAPILLGRITYQVPSMILHMHGGGVKEFTVWHDRLYMASPVSVSDSISGRNSRRSPFPIAVYDLTSLDHPVFTANLELPYGWAEDISVQGSRLVAVFGQTGAVGIADVHDAAAPKWVGLHREPGWVHTVLIRDELAYVLDTTGLFILDVSQPDQPLQLSDLAYPLAPSNSSSNDNLLVYYAGYLYGISDHSSWDSNLIIIDVHDAHRPVLTGTAPLGQGLGSRLALSGHHLLAEVVIPGFETRTVYTCHVFDLADPTSPAEVTSNWCSSGQGTVFADRLGHPYWMAFDNERVRSFDLGNLPDLTQVGEWHGGTPWLSGALVHDGIAFMGEGYDDPNFWVLDVTDPTVLRTISESRQYGGVGMQYREGYLFITSSRFYENAATISPTYHEDINVDVIDVRDPRSPRDISPNQRTLEGVKQGVWLWYPYFDGGVIVVRVPPYDPVLMPTATASATPYATPRPTHVRPSPTATATPHPTPTASPASPPARYRIVLPQLLRVDSNDG